MLILNASAVTKTIRSVEKLSELSATPKYFLDPVHRDGNFTTTSTGEHVAVAAVDIT